MYRVFIPTGPCRPLVAHFLFDIETHFRREVGHGGPARRWIHVISVIVIPALVGIGYGPAVKGSAGKRIGLSVVVVGGWYGDTGCGAAYLSFALYVMILVNRFVAVGLALYVYHAGHVHVVYYGINGSRQHWKTEGLFGWFVFHEQILVLVYRAQHRVGLGVSVRLDVHLDESEIADSDPYLTSHGSFQVEMEVYLDPCNCAHTVPRRPHVTGQIHLVTLKCACGCGDRFRARHRELFLVMIEIGGLLVIGFVQGDMFCISHKNPVIPGLHLRGVEKEWIAPGWRRRALVVRWIGYHGKRDRKKTP